VQSWRDFNEFPSLGDARDDDIDQYVSNICRCGTCSRMRAAIHKAAEAMPGSSEGNRANSYAIVHCITHQSKYVLQQ
jgi:hypothetical protein